MKNMKSKKIHRGWYLLPLLLALSACGGGNSGGVGNEEQHTDASVGGGVLNDAMDSGSAPVNGTLSYRPVNSALSFILANNGDVLASASSLDVPLELNTVMDTQRQLVSGMEVVLERPTLSTDQVFSATIKSNMAGHVMHGFALVISSEDGSSEAIEYNFLPEDIFLATAVSPYLKNGDGIDVSIRLPESLRSKSLQLSVFADTADHIYYMNGASNPPAEAEMRTEGPYNAQRVARNFDELQEFIDNAVWDTLITFDIDSDNEAGNENDADANTLELDRGLQISTKITLEGERGAGMTLKSGLSGNQPMFSVLSTGNSLNPDADPTEFGYLVLKYLTLEGGRNSALVIYMGAVAELLHTHFKGNHSTNGGAIQNSGRLLMSGDGIFAARFSDNTASLRGGAIFNAAGAKIEIEGDTRFSNNGSNHQGGAIYSDGWVDSLAMGQRLPNIDFMENHSDQGGAIYTNHNLDLTQSSVFFEGNVAQTFGGAVVNNKNASISNARFEGNQAGSAGGAIQHQGQSLSLQGNVFTLNRARPGAAINTCGTTLTMRTSLIFSNEFPDVESGWFGNGINVYRACQSATNTQNNPGSLSRQTIQTAMQLDLEHVTIWNNNGEEGMYGTGINLGSGTSARIRNSIVASNKGGDLFVSDVHSEDPESVHFESSNSFFSLLEEFPVGSGDIASTDPFNPLDPAISLDPTGLPGLQAYSLAVNAGQCDNSTEELDYLGNPRVIGGACDMGAIELTDADLQQTVGAGSLVILDFRPDHSTVPDVFEGPEWVELDLAEARLWIDGSVSTEQLTALSYRINGGPSQSVDISAIGSDGNFSISTGIWYDFDAGAIRKIADGLNVVSMEALFANGSVVTDSKEFYPGFCPQSTSHSPCNYTRGAIADAVTAPAIAGFSYWQVNSVSTDNFKVTIEYGRILNGYVQPLSQSIELQQFSYRINDQEPVALNFEEMSAALQSDGSYMFDIPVSGLVEGRNTVVYGSVYADTYMRTDVLHFDY